jgi:phospholipid/cholesterol/gamma-HCH transport system permease protein
LNASSHTEHAAGARLLPDDPNAAPGADADFDIVPATEGELRVRFRGALNVHSAAPLLRRLRADIKPRSFNRLTADLEGVEDFDDYGALILIEMRRWADAKKSVFQRIDTHDKSAKVLSLIDFDAESLSPPAISKRPPGWIARLGIATLALLDQARFMIAFLGSVFLASIAVLKNPRALRIGDVLSNMEKTGVNALPIIALISCLLGLVMAFMSSLQLQQFGANIYVASLVAIAMVSELGPIMTAIVTAGRSGSAFAAEIGTMKISEEIDALTVMGFDPVQFLALPRILAALLVIPLLTLFANIFAIMGGLFVGVALLDLTAATYLNRTLEALDLFEVAWGFGKSVVFAATIAMVGCMRGFQTRGGADAVGNAATSAVVTSIFLIILLDSIFAVLRSYWQ